MGSQRFKFTLKAFKDSKLCTYGAGPHESKNAQSFSKFNKSYVFSFKYIYTIFFNTMTCKYEFYLPVQNFLSLIIFFFNLKHI